MCWHQVGAGARCLSSSGHWAQQSWLTGYLGLHLALWSPKLAARTAPQLLWGVRKDSGGWCLVLVWQQTSRMIATAVPMPWWSGEELSHLVSANANTDGVKADEIYR